MRTYYRNYVCSAIGSSLPLYAHSFLTYVQVKNTIEAALRVEYDAIKASDEYVEQSTITPLLRTPVKAPAEVRAATRAKIDAAVHLLNLGKIGTLEEVLYARQLERSLRISHQERLELIPQGSDSDSSSDHDSDSSSDWEGDELLDEVETDTDDEVN